MKYGAKRVFAISPDGKEVTYYGVALWVYFADKSKRFYAVCETGRADTPENPLVGQFPSSWAVALELNQ
jgi:hypothetical protein